MNEQNTTKKSHFIPRFYLKTFTNQQGIIQTLDVKNNRLCSPKSYCGVGYKEYFYGAQTGVPDELSRQVEKWLNFFENIIAQKLPLIINKILNYEHIDNDDKYFLSSFMCMLWLRSPGMRNQINKTNEEMTKKIFGFNAEDKIDDYIEKNGINLSGQERSDIIKNIETGNYNIKFNNIQHIRFMIETLGFDGPGFTNMFFGHNWKIYISKSKKRFITSDSPVVEWWLPTTVICGANFLNRNKYFALTPEIFIELTPPEGSSKVRRKTLFDDNDNIIDLYNILIAAHSYEYVYSVNKISLEKLINGRKNHGQVEMTYYNDFQLPWDKFKRENPVI
jgi:hypothetical protein